MTLGERFVRAVAAKDRDELREVLAGDVDFKGLTPRRVGEGDVPRFAELKTKRGPRR